MKTLREYIDLVNTLSLLEWAPTPEQLKWLGGANQQDPYIMARMPGAKPPVTWFTDPADQEIARRAKFPETEPAAPAAAVATPVADPTPAVATPLPAAPAAPAAPAPVVAAPTPAKPPAGQSAKPTAPNPVMTLQNKLIALGAKITADGKMGPKTQAAMKEYGLDANGNPVKDAKTGQPVTNTKTATAIIQRGGVDPKEITPDAVAAQQVRSDLEAQRANTITRTDAPTTTRADGREVYTTVSGKQVAVDSLEDKRRQRQAEYQAQNEATKARLAAEKAARDAAKVAASGKPPVTAPVTAAAAPVTAAAAPVTAAAAPAAAAPVTGNVPPRPVNPKEKLAWAREFAKTHNPDGTPLSEGRGYDEIDRLIGLVHYR